MEFLVNRSQVLEDWRVDGVGERGAESEMVKGPRKRVDPGIESRQLDSLGTTVDSSLTAQSRHWVCSFFGA